MAEAAYWRDDVISQRFRSGWHDAGYKRLEARKMPVNVVRTREDEIAWERAKARAREKYPDATGEGFYRVLMAIYKKMAHYQSHSSVATDKAAD
jgi:hypothetical protein